MKAILSPKQDKVILRKRKKCSRKFLFYFPKGFSDKKYEAWERSYKWNAHVEWTEQLNKKEFSRLLGLKAFDEICKRVIRTESRTNLLFSFEKMAFRDAVKTPASSRAFAEGLFDYIYGDGDMAERFEKFKEVLASLPVKQTRVLTWPLITVLGFIADPQQHIFLKPMVTRRAAEKYHYDFLYHPKVNWKTYQNLLDFAELIRRDTKSLHPKDMIDLQSFIWVMGSEEYPD